MNPMVPTSVCLLLLGGACSALAANSFKQAANAEEAVSRIEELGGSVRLIVAKGKELEADFQFSGNALADEHLQLLKHLPEIVVLRLKNVAVTDAGGLAAGGTADESYFAGHERDAQHADQIEAEDNDHRAGDILKQPLVSQQKFADSAGAGTESNKNQ